MEPEVHRKVSAKMVRDDFRRRQKRIERRRAERARAEKGQAPRYVNPEAERFAERLLEANRDWMRDRIQQIPEERRWWYGLD
jgi:hypothetical protein